MASDRSGGVSPIPSLAGSRKGSMQALNKAVSASSSVESLSNSAQTTSPKMTNSVMARAKAFEQRGAAAQRTGTFSPLSSPPLPSPFIKTFGASFVVPQPVSRPLTSPNADGSRRSSPRDLGNRRDDMSRTPSPSIQSSTPPQPQLQEYEHEQEQEQERMQEQERGDSPTRPVTAPAPIPDRRPSAAGLDRANSDDDYDETPRQSTITNPTSKPNVSRHDSSRVQNYSLKPRTYSPDPESDGKRSNRADPPKLPKLYFESTITEIEEGGPPSSKSINSPYRSPNSELAKAGWTGDEPQRDARSGQNLAVPSNIHQGQMVESPPANEDDEMDASNRSFFWHSPHDSTEETDDEEDEVGVEDNPGGFPSLRRENPNSLTSASALGFGGPSNWEHFYDGDYTTAMVDDTDIYLSKKEKDKQTREENDRATAAEAARRNSEVDTSAVAEAAKSDQEIKKPAEQEPKALERPLLPTIEENEEPSGIVTTEVTYNTDDLSGFAKSPPPMTPANFQDRQLEHQATVSHKGSDDTITDTSRKTMDSSSMHEPPTTEVSKAPEAPEEERQRPDSDIEPRPPTVVVSQASRTPPPPEIKLPPTDFTSPDTLQSGPSSPPVDDPNAEQITVSMVLPPDFDARSQQGIPNSLAAAVNAIVQPPRQSPPPRTPPPPVPGQGPRPKSVFPQADEQPNPYAGLSSMAKASLNRFIRMLREEGKAESDSDKFYVFISFAQHEMKLRATLYDMDDESELSLPPSARASLRSSLNKKTKSQPSLRSKPLPVPPPPPETMPPPPPSDPTTGRFQSMAASRFSQPAPPGPPPNRAPPPTPKRAGTEISAKSSDESFVMVDKPKTEEASTTSPLPNTSSSPEGDQSQSSLETLTRSIELVAPRSIMGSDPPLSATTPTSPNNPTSEQQSATSSPLPGPQILSHSLSVKSNENKPYDGDKASNRQSIYRPFSGMLRSSSSQRRASLESNHTVKSMERTPERKGSDPESRTTSLAVPTGDRRESRRQSRRESRAREKKPPKSEIQMIPRPPGFRPGPLEPLLQVIPQSNVLCEEPQQLVRLRFDMNNILDDFSFIHQTVLTWDSGAKLKSSRYYDERQERMAENERRLDELFNDNEISYSEISQLEADFKQSESIKKTDEEKEEVDSFVTSVFDVVWTRINYEMEQLNPLYDEATELVASASAGRLMFDNSDNSCVPIAPIMDVLLTLYQKLMIRHQKAFEAVLERDRRLKKTEVSPWFAVGAIDQVRRIEKRFEDAEKEAILRFCRARDDRANLLMDVLDQHTLRGVGANQDYMESVMQAVRKITLHIAVKGAGSEDEPLSTDEVAKAKAITVALARSSEQIVRTFHVADMLLNAADYEVSVANAKLSNADANAFRRLREAKAKEDAKLVADLEHRLGLIRGDTSRTQEEVAKLMLLLGCDDLDAEAYAQSQKPGGGGGGGGRGPPFDLAKERDKRVTAALETAVQKKKNKAAGAAPGSTSAADAATAAAAASDAAQKQEKASNGEQKADQDQGQGQTAAEKPKESET